MTKFKLGEGNKIAREIEAVEKIIENLRKLGISERSDFKHVCIQMVYDGFNDGFNVGDDKRFVSSLYGLCKKFHQEKLEKLEKKLEEL